VHIALHCKDNECQNVICYNIWTLFQSFSTKHNVYHSFKTHVLYIIMWTYIVRTEDNRIYALYFVSLNTRKSNVFKVINVMVLNIADLRKYIVIVRYLSIFYNNIKNLQFFNFYQTKRMIREYINICILFSFPSEAMNA